MTMDLEAAMPSWPGLPTGAPKKIRVYARNTATAEFSNDDFSDVVDYSRPENDFYPAKRSSPRGFGADER